MAYNWKFCLYPEADAPADVFSPAWDDSAWEVVRVPHDWAASGVFDEYNDCSYAAVVDAQGVVCPHADHRITFTNRGAGELLTTDSGDQRETESFARPDKRPWPAIPSPASAPCETSAEA